MRFPTQGRGKGLPVDSVALAAVLDEFAATVTRDFSLDDILRQLSEAVTRVLSVDGAGVVGTDPVTGRLRLVHSSEGSVRQLEEIQERLQRGPCHESIDRGQVINLADIGLEGGWPDYQQSADDLGVHAVTTVPLLARGRVYGALDVYRHEPTPLSAAELGAVTTLANLATSYLVVAEDRDTALRVQQELAQRAMYDALTSLPVRWVFIEHLAHALERLRRTPHLVVVLFLDFDGLKYVNDTYGHAAGDQLIVTSLERIRSALRPADILARIGGDEFVVLLEDVVRLKDATEVAERIIGRLSEPYRPEGQDIRPSASIGIAATAEPDTSGATLIAHADSAMYEAKRAGGGRFTVFDPTRYALDRSSAAGREQLARELEEGLSADQFEVHYQPIVDLQASRSDSLHAVEALVRWRHPERGLLSAAAFIEAAEECGTLPALGAWVLRSACEQLAAWDALGTAGPQRLFVNLSPVELFQPGLVASVAATLQEVGVDPRRLTIEITETGLVQESEAGTRLVDALLSLGCQLAIDDFGTGYSSLSRLIDIPATTVKIDRAFTLGLLERSDAVAIVSAVCVLATSLRRSVVAEGVEDEDTLQRLRDLGVRYVQGFHLARPMPAEELTAWALGSTRAGAMEPG